MRRSPRSAASSPGWSRRSAPAASPSSGEPPPRSSQRSCAVRSTPRARGEVDRLLASPLEQRETLLDWTDAGPLAAEESWDRYRHDSGVSVSWGWHEPPRQQVTSGVLTRLLSPGRYGKRVTILYRALSAGESARILEDAGQRGRLPRRLPQGAEAGRDRPRRRRPHPRPAGRPRGSPGRRRRPDEHVRHRDGHRRARPVGGGRRHRGPGRAVQDPRATAVRQPGRGLRRDAPRWGPPAHLATRGRR